MVRPRKSPVPDGRVNNGGARQGTPGQSYGNRSDLRGQPVATAKGQGYGVAAAQAASQRVVPLAAAPAPPSPAPPSPAPPSPPAAAFATPEDTPNLLDPTTRPGEPLTHGMPFGPGAGPEVLGAPQMSDVEARLRALYLAHPTQELRELIRQQDLSS